MNPLVAPGNYNLTFNQEYLLRTLYLKIPFVILGIIVVLYILYHIHRFRVPEWIDVYKKGKAIEAKRQIKEMIEREIEHLSYIISNYQDEKAVMGTSDEVLLHRFGGEIRRLLSRLEPYDDFIYLHISAFHKQKYESAKRIILQMENVL